MKQDVGNYKYQLILDIATKYKMNPNAKMSPEEAQLVRLGQKNMGEWNKQHEPGLVPYD